MKWTVFFLGAIAIFALSIGTCKLLTINHPVRTDSDRLAVILFFIVSVVFWLAPVWGIVRVIINKDE